MKFLKYCLTALGLTTALSLVAQDRESQGIDEMWGKHKIVARSVKGDMAALFDYGNYLMFIHWGLYSNIVNKWRGVITMGLVSGS